jgi:tetratricopeptide (TPR) repeat protein
VDESEELFPNDAELAAVAATYPEPIRTAARAARTAPPSAEKYALLSAAAYRAGRFQTAVGAARLATEIDRACLIGWINLGAALGALERFEEEIEACRVALKLDPTNALAARNLAWAESRVKETATRPAAK